MSNVTPRRKRWRLVFGLIFGGLVVSSPVSYTHLDVYKRQERDLMPTFKRVAHLMRANKTSATKYQKIHVTSIVITTNSVWNLRKQKEKKNYTVGITRRPFPILRCV